MANAKNTRKRRARRTQKPVIENAITFHSGGMKTIELTLNFKSDMMNQYLMGNTRQILMAFERLAQIFRLTSDTPSAYQVVKEWQASNIEICEKQLEALAAQREIIEKKLEVEAEEPKTPESYKVKFEFSHPVGRQIYDLMKSVDEELDAIEYIFLAGAIDDIEYRAAKMQAMSILRGCIDRIYKATSPGKREGGQFDTKYFAQLLREGHEMGKGVDKPLEFQEKEQKTDAA